MNFKKISIVIPTFREAENVPVLTEKINEVMKKASLDYEIVVVDDDSNDGIIEKSESLQKKYPYTLVVRKEEKGLSSAVIEGFKHITGDIIVVMDADLSHPPEKIPELVAPIIDKRAEFVIGSRFVEGGSARHFDWFRKLNAWASKVLARPFTKVKDPMAGFFAFPAHKLTPETELNPAGFKIGLELIVKTDPLNIEEIPIEFQERLYGESKLSLKEQLLYLVHLRRLFKYKFRTLSEMIRFGIIGASGMLVDLTSVYVAKELFSVEFRYARIAGFVFALTSNFLLNRSFTFRNAREGHILKQYVSFFTVSLAGFALNWFISVYLYENSLFFNTHYLLAALMGIIGGFFINFTGSKFFVFK